MNDRPTNDHPTPASAEPTAEPRLRIPADVRETPEGWRLDLALPGVRAEDVEVRLEGDRLEVSARRAPWEGDGLRRLQGRIPAGRLVRSFLVPEGTSPEGVEATLDQGVLRIALRRSVPARRSIEVRTA